MAKSASLLAFGLLLLAGCSSGPEPSAETLTPTSTVTTTVGAPAAPRLTDTLHFLGYPAMTQQPPDDYAELRFPVQAFNDGLVASASGPTKTWTYDLAQDLSGLVGNVTFWVEVKGTVLNNPNPLAGGCFWEFRIIVSADIDGGKYSPCGTEAATVAPGVREIVFPIEFSGVAAVAGQRIQFDFYTQDFGRAPDATVDLLTYSIDHDSRISLVGLEVPLDPSLLLRSTA